MNPHRETLSCIIPGLLYMGSVHVAEKTVLLSEYGISHVISIGTPLEHQQYERFAQEDFFYHRIVLDDVADAPLTKKMLHEACDFIMSATSPTFVHCWAGISRSATIVLAHLMRDHKMTLKEAYELVKKKRPIIQPNLGFMAKLNEGF